jgi:hypothetical protein
MRFTDKGHATPAPGRAVEREVLAQADALVTKQAGLSRQVDDLYELASALMPTVGGILRSEAADKGAKVQTALAEFTSAVLGKLRDAGVSVPTQKRGSALIPEHVEAAILKTALTLAPQDPQGLGMTAIAAALKEIQRYAVKRTAA